MTEEQATAAYTALYLEYQVLWDAACQAAIDAGAAKPGGASERAMAGVLAHQGPRILLADGAGTSPGSRGRAGAGADPGRLVRAGDGRKRLHARFAGRLRQVPAWQRLAGEGSAVAPRAEAAGTLL